MHERHSSHDFTNVSNHTQQSIGMPMDGPSAKAIEPVLLSRCA